MWIHTVLWAELHVALRSFSCGNDWGLNSHLIARSNLWHINHRSPVWVRSLEIWIQLVPTWLSRQTVAKVHTSQSSTNPAISSSSWVWLPEEPETLEISSPPVLDIHLSTRGECLIYTITKQPSTPCCSKSASAEDNKQSERDSSFVGALLFHSSSSWYLKAPPPYIPIYIYMAGETGHPLIFWMFFTYLIKLAVWIKSKSTFPRTAAPLPMSVDWKFLYLSVLLKFIHYYLFSH